MPKVKVPAGPELFFGLVGPIGTDLDRVTEILGQALSAVNYRMLPMRLSDLLYEIASGPPILEAPLEERYRSLMAKGTYLREATGHGDALAILAVRQVERLRREQALNSSEERLTSGSPRPDHVDRRQERDHGAAPLDRTAYVMRSLKHPKEVERLRTIYGKGFFLIGAYESRERRLRNLERRIADSHNAYPPTARHTHLADDLIAIDEKETSTKLGQNVSGCFHLSDFFVDVSESDSTIRTRLERFIGLVFGHQLHTPSRDENAMFHARAASLRSAELGRQVGAVITTSKGAIVAVGTNEVPRAGGGQYWPPSGEEPDNREFTTGGDTSDTFRRNNLAEVLEILRSNGMLSANLSEQTETDRLKAILPLMEGTRMMAATEFGKAVHAEMAAICDAAMRGVSVQDCTLYTTTFPCHNCARHIVAVGITRVVFIEPYAKSLASDFHETEIGVETRPTTDKVTFVPFVGIAPNLYIDLFTMWRRKQEGVVVKWDGSVAVPKLVPPVLRYVEEEGEAAKQLVAAMERGAIQRTPQSEDSSAETGMA